MREIAVNIALAAGLLATVVWAHLAGETFTITLATRIAILALAATGLNLALGLGGMVSFGHAAFFGIGGYAAGILAYHAGTYTDLISWPVAITGTSLMPVIWLVAIAASGLVALFIGAISLRTSGVYFIMITLAFAQMIYYLAISAPAYGGEDGLPIYVRNAFPGVNTLQPLSFFLVAFGALLAGIWAVARIGGSRFGARLEAARQNEARLSAVGIEPFKVKLTGFVASAMITSLAGALMADLNRFVSPSMLSWHMSGEIMVLVILGGVGRLYGPLAGAILYVVMEHELGALTERWQLFLGLALLAVVLFARGGLMGLLAGARRHG